MQRRDPSQHSWRALPTRSDTRKGEWGVARRDRKHSSGRPPRGARQPHPQSRAVDPKHSPWRMAPRVGMGEKRKTRGGGGNSCTPPEPAGEPTEGRSGGEGKGRPRQLDRKPAPLCPRPYTRSPTYPATHPHIAHTHPTRPALANLCSPASAHLRSPSRLLADSTQKDGRARTRRVRPSVPSRP